MFFFAFFSSPSSTLFKIGKKKLYFVAFIDFSENRWNVFSLNVFFHRPPSLDFCFFSDLKHRNKNKWPKGGKFELCLKVIERRRFSTMCPILIIKTNMF